MHRVVHRYTATPPTPATCWENFESRHRVVKAIVPEKQGLQQRDVNVVLKPMALTNRYERHFDDMKASRHHELECLRIWHFVTTQ